MNLLDVFALVHNAHRFSEKIVNCALTICQVNIEVIETYLDKYLRHVSVLDERLRSSVKRNIK